MLICTEALPNIDTKIDADSMKGLLEMCTKDAVFMFDQQLYKQVDGVAMGSPLGPLLANIFMCHAESKWLEDCPEHFRPLLYRRYVDDILLVFRTEAHAKPFLEYLNSRHCNIKFTCESEHNGVLPFLDINITRGELFETSVYRKPTFTGLYMNYTSFVPQLFKCNLVKCLFTRAFRICSSYISLHAEFEIISNILCLNDYPKNLIQRLQKKLSLTDCTQTMHLWPLLRRKSFFCIFLLLVNMACRYKHD